MGFWRGHTGQVTLEGRGIGASFTASVLLPTRDGRGKLPSAREEGRGGVKEKWWHHITKGTHVLYFTFLISSLGVVYWIEVNAEGRGLSTGHEGESCRSPACVIS